MKILLDCSIRIKKYLTQLHSHEAEVVCPTCQKRMRKHGSYSRQVVYKSRTYLIPVQRRCCRGCKITLSLLPCFLIPWARFANHIREFMGRWLFQGIPLACLPERLTTTQTSILSLRTLYRWKGTLKKKFQDWWVKQRAELAHQFEEEEGLLDLYRNGMNTEQELRLLFSLFLGEERAMRKGHLFSRMNLRLSDTVFW
ncbi:DUF6431 domain-containing protein [Brevibacillus agri]|uniref:DUF6431 domain-containing protein n=1 Tax=Brevibacillus agri TaxID=51101 RepID=UPI003D1FE056